MTVLCAIVGVLFIVGGLGACAVSTGAIHEIGGMVGLLIGFVLISCAAVLERLSVIHGVMNDIKNGLAREWDDTHKPTP
jgi:uncharacterized membrane protein